jgi:hypothetical protein
MNQVVTVVIEYLTIGFIVFSAHWIVGAVILARYIKVNKNFQLPDSMRPNISLIAFWPLSLAYVVGCMFFVVFAFICEIFSQLYNKSNLQLKFANFLNKLNQPKLKIQTEQPEIATYRIQPKQIAKSEVLVQNDTDLISEDFKKDPLFYFKDM